MMTAVDLRARWQQGTPAFGAWCAFSDSFSTELLAAQGFDYVCIDQQHGLNSYSHLVPQLQAVTAAGSIPFARVNRNEPGLIGKVLDAGAQAVVVPLVNNAEEARSAVEACRFPPRGNRSFGPTRARLAWGSGQPEELDQALCIAMVETSEALEKVEEIASTDGVDAIYIGPSDLSLALGHSPADGVETAEFTDALTRIVKACRDAGIGVGIHCADGATAQGYAKEGYDLVTVLSDWSTLVNSARDQLTIART